MEKNLISIEFSTQELNKLDNALQAIESVFKGKTHNLTPEERQQFGSIAEQNKLFVNKVKRYMEEYPQYVPEFLDKAEFDKDYEARQIIEGRLMRLSGLTEQLADTKIMLDNDNYHNALTFYRKMQFLSREDIPGTSNIVQDLSQFFKRSTQKKNNETAKKESED